MVQCTLECHLLTQCTLGYLMTSEPDSVSTLGYHWTDYTGTLLEPQVHWDATGTTLVDASAQWCPSGDPVLICIIETHWNTTGANKCTGMPLEPHWLMPAPSGDPVLICIIGTHWNTTWRPLEDHWKHTGYQQFFLQWHSSVHWGLVPDTLDFHWITTGLPLAQGKGPFQFIKLSADKFRQWPVHRQNILRYLKVAWWRYQMETFSALLALCAGNSLAPLNSPQVTWSFDVFFDLRLNKRLNKQVGGWWLETPSRSLWRHCNDFFGWLSVIAYAFHILR